MSARRCSALRGADKPLVADPFHQNRWDYYYSYRKDGKLVEQRHVALYFTGDTLERVDGTVD